MKINILTIALTSFAVTSAVTLPDTAVMDTLLERGSVRSLSTYPVHHWETS